MDVLVSLSDNVVSMYDTQTLTIRPQLPKIKNAYLFAVSSSIEIEEGIPAIVTRLCVAVKKKLVVYTWQDMELVETKEFNIPDRVRKITWASSTKLCSSFTKGYAILDLPSGKVTELFANAGEGSGLGSSLSELGSMAIGAMGMILNAGKPLIVRLPNDELLVEKDNVSIFIGPDGTPTRKAGISWSAAPEELGYSFPYAIAILSKHVEIRNIGTQRLVQNIELTNPQMMTQGKVIYIASSDHVWRLIPLDFMKQIDQLVEVNEFEEALSLLDQIEKILPEEKNAQLTRIRNLYAHFLFRNGGYEQALSMFQELDADPVEVISLYPPVIAGTLSKADEQDGGSTLEGGNLKDAIEALVGFLTDWRRKVSKTLSSNGETQSIKRVGSSATLSSLSTNVESVVAKSSISLPLLAQLIDTTLLKAYLNSNDALVGPLLRVSNHCNVAESETLLLQHKKYRELVDLYRGKGLHRKSLQLLTKLGRSSGNPLSGCSSTVIYLQKLGVDDFDLVLEFSPWVLQTDPELGLSIFTEDMSEVVAQPRARVVEHLDHYAPDLCIPYLEHIIHELEDNNPEFHNTLIILYLNNVMNAENDQIVEPVTEDHNSTRQKLIKFLTESTFYKAEKILGQLTTDGFYEERAILLSRMGLHEQALNIYVHKLGDFAKAESYCKEHWTPELFVTLLRIYLKPSNPEDSPLIEPAIALLASYGSSIDVSEVLSMLPEDTKLENLNKYFEKYLRELHKNSRMNHVVSSLLRAEGVQVQEKLVHYRSRYVKITEDRMCPHCLKRIGNSVFAVFPNGVVVHYSCKEKMGKGPLRAGKPFGNM
ncbi:hypothetical protein K493DRAFT_335529 [Basidiobolus meristosporus CBS 931.73]|uniref:CNH domain-containing protein n=1 Tax=Basidiobolus meristosporus CBS 931.73 TaxID=1314790 RepID=A0A1Y1YQ79_9FUNG|nr:hypothetical protein K493DRAFT_335529 [Basidiobolus meristosporus CBS 931.73]|eukprot:ORX99906.1 hypothetical protein K493DRAFT_335529 [Basidiobolus meristosporus CBS 931.73]